MILEAFQMNFQNKNYIFLIKQFKRTAIPHILGFKFSFYSKHCSSQIPLVNLQNVLENDPNLVPRNLVLVTAYLIKHKLLDIHDIWPHFSPSDQDIEQTYLKRLQIAIKQFKNVFHVKLKQDSDQKKKGKELEAQEQLEIFNQLICIKIYFFLFIYNIYFNYNLY